MAGQLNALTSPMPAELSRALAQAVAGFLREGMYFTASFTQLSNPDSPYDIGGPFFEPNLPDVNELGDGYGLFGPFDNTMSGLIVPVQQAYVTKVTIHTSVGTQFDIDADDLGLKYDAMFFSVEAVSKFAVPYYTGVYSPTMAANMLPEFQHSSLALMVHLPWSESEDLGVTGHPDPMVTYSAQGEKQVVSGPDGRGHDHGHGRRHGRGHGHGHGRQTPRKAGSRAT